MKIVSRARRDITVENHALAVLLSANTAADTAHQYITHLDIRPDQFAHFAKGWTMEAVVIVEAGLRGASNDAPVTQSTTVKNFAFRIGRPEANTPGTLPGLQFMSGPSMSSTQNNGVMNLQGVCRQGTNGVGLEVINTGIGYPGFTGNAITRTAEDWKTSGIRVCMAGSWAAAVAGNIIKILSFRVKLCAQP